MISELENSADLEAAALELWISMVDSSRASSLIKEGSGKVMTEYHLGCEPNLHGCVTGNGRA